jgi:putative membrane protein
LSDAQWLKEETRHKVRDAIVALEASSSAEVVATVSVRSGHYRHADYLLGALLSLLSLLFYLLYPEPLFDDVAGILIVASFGLGVVLSLSVHALRRLFLSRTLMNEEVTKAARSRFVDQGISRTRDRTGILIYVSLFERRVEVVPDIGIPVEQLGDRWKDAVAALDRSAKQGVDAFLSALGAMGPMLAQAVPRSVDDVNELPDEVVKA